jgi:aminomuconate-semialdehyde/2-hydroxymuconate-6-semialdehyde dehydrogenase
MQDIANYIGGELVPASSGRSLDNFEPATGLVYSKVPDSDETDVARAVEAAERAFPAWSALPSVERSHLLRRAGELIRQQLDDLARAESTDSGKPFSLARSLDIPRAAQNFEFFADAATQWSTECHVEGSVLNYTLRRPLGVVGCISPWNLPLYLLSWKIAPALAAGNCVVAKPSEITPMTAFLLAKLCRQAGFPPGVLNIVQGLGRTVGAALSQHPKVSAVSFTGSTRTGAEIARVAGPTFKKLSLEMGGKNPSVIFADCDFEAAVAGTVRSGFLNQGQICLCGSRIFIERPLYERFKAALVQRVTALRQGDPLEEATQQGAVVSQAHLEKVLGYVELAKQEGARVLCGGKQAHLSGRCAKGWFIEPTLVEGLGPMARTNQDEIFGPMATLMPFDSEEEVLGWANGTRYGLAANVWTRDLSRAHRFSAKLSSGIVWVNCWMVRDLRTPFGGTKESGVGHEGGLDAYRFVTEPKNVCIQVQDAQDA